LISVFGSTTNMERNTEKNGLVNMLGLLVACVVAAVIGKIANSATSAVGAVFLGMGFLVAAISYFQMRLENREHLEQLEFEEIAKDRNRSALFDESGDDTFLAKKARQQFERFFCPCFYDFTWNRAGCCRLFSLEMVARCGVSGSHESTSGHGCFFGFCRGAFHVGQIQLRSCST